MNYFAHARHFLDDPYFVAGTAVPDWLTVVDRGVRVRSKHAGPLCGDADRRVAAVARGIMQHIRDDARFHETRAFAETSLALTVLSRDALGADGGFRPSFLGHVLVEILLDAALIAAAPERLETYYRRLESVDANLVQASINRMAPRRTERLAWMVFRFCQERVLWDYAADDKLMVRLNQVMRRVRCPELPESFRGVLPAARELVAGRRAELLQGIPVADGDLDRVAPGPTTEQSEQPPDIRRPTPCNLE
jgi:hypothetical protein